MTNHVERLRRLFPTLPGAYYRRGSEGRFDDTKAKWAFSQRAVKQPLTDKLIELHLNAKEIDKTETTWSFTEEGLAISPFLTDGKSVKFLCIDIDIYNISLGALTAHLKNTRLASLPMVPARTKSGGWHLFLFFSVPVLAQGVVTACKKFKTELVAELKCDKNKIEYRPVQHTINIAEGDIGTGITLPLYASSFEEQEEWLMLAENSIVEPEVLNGALDEGQFSDAPPCIFPLLEQGRRSGWTDTGFRNNLLYQVGVFFRKKSPTSWQDELRRFNDNECRKGADELDTLITSIEKMTNTKAYRCGDIFETVCNKGLCGQRKFGIGSQAAHELIDLTGITRIDGDPVLWYLTINAPSGPKRLKLTTDELYSADTLRKKCMEHSVLPDLPKGKQWDEHLRLILSNTTAIEQSESMSDAQITEDLIWRFFESTVTSSVPHDILQGKIYLENEPDVCYAYFTHAMIKGFADRVRAKSADLYNQMQALVLNGTAGIAIIKLQSIKMDVWQIPVPSFRLALEMEQKIK